MWQGIGVDLMWDPTLGLYGHSMASLLHSSAPILLLYNTNSSPAAFSPFLKRLAGPKERHISPKNVSFSRPYSVGFGILLWANLVVFPSFCSLMCRWHLPVTQNQKLFHRLMQLQCVMQKACQADLGKQIFLL